jgi:4-amino-4-deoxychorismate mutase
MNLHDLRGRLDGIDSEIVRLLGQRFAVCREIAAYKSANGIPMMQPHRIQQVTAKYEALAIEHAVDGEFARRLGEAIIAEACRIEEAEMRAGAADEKTHS